MAEIIQFNKYASSKNVDGTLALRNISEPTKEELREMEEMELCEDELLEYSESNVLFDEESLPSAFALFMKEAGREKLLTAKEEVALFEIYHSDDKEKAARAKEKLIQANLRLVIKVASKYKTYGMEMLDLVQEGVIGLMTAIERFDISRGTKLSTYATFWIRQAIERAIMNKNNLIRVPVHLESKFFSVLNVQKELQKLLEREPSVKEIAEKMDIEEEKVKTILYYGQCMRLKSIDSTIVHEHDDSETTLGELLADDSLTPEEEIVESDTKHQLWKICESCLSEKEYEIVKLRFGYYGSRLTLAQVGEQFHVTRERIRQIESKAIEKLSKKKHLLATLCG